MRLVVWGAGELGGRVGAMWARTGQPVLGVTQSTRRHAALCGYGIDPHVGGVAEVLTPADALLLALPGHMAQQAAVASLSATAPPARVVLISSTGYYGTPQGRVDETSPPGNTARAAAIAAAELTCRAWAGAHGVVLRLGGLYCRGRGPLAALLRRGAVLPGPPDTTLSLIHYHDAATATLAALQLPAPEPTYLGVVPPCPSRRDFYLCACHQAKLSAPEFDPPLGLPPVVHDTTLLRRDLLPTPAHPDWHDALRL
jgi:nucleoside-diphosphate-sugar epimerase